MTTDYTVSGWDSAANDALSLTVSVTEDSVTKTGTFTVKIIAKSVIQDAALESITATLSDAASITTESNEAAVKTALVVKAKLVGVADEVTLAASDYTLSTIDFANTTTEQTITVSYTKDEVTKETTFKLTVAEPPAEDSVTTAIETTAKGTYTYASGDETNTIIAVGGIIVDVTKGTDKAEEVGEYTIADGAVSGTFGGEAFTATTDKDGRIASITIGETEIPLAYTSAATTYTLASAGTGGGEDPVEDTTVYFTKFVASDLESSKDGVKYALGDKDANDTWEIVTGKSSEQVSNKTASLKSYDGKEFTARLSLEKADRGIKIKVGAGKTKIIRIDASNSKSSISSEEAGTITVGSVDWAYKVCAVTKFFEVTGDSDGWVSIVMKDGKANILAIEVVDAIVNTSAQTLTASSISVSDPELTLSAATGTGDNADAYVVNSAISVTAAAPTYSVDTYTAPADGSTVATKTAGTATAIESPTWTYSWTQDGEAIESATDASYTPAASGTYVVKAKYTATVNETEKTSAEKTAEFVVINPNAEKVKVTFKAGEGTFAEGATTEFEIEKGKTLALANVTAPTATPTDNTKVFKEWTSNVDGVTIESAISQNVTFTATYDNAPSVYYLSGAWTALDYAPSGTVSDKTAATDGSKLGGAVTVNGGVWRVSSSKWSSLELTKSSAGYLTFTIEKTSTITVTASSTGTKESNVSDAVLKTGTALNSATAVSEKMSVTSTKATSNTGNATTFTYENCAAGTYYFGTFGSNNSNLRVYTVTVTAAQ